MSTAYVSKIIAATLVAVLLLALPLARADALIVYESGEALYRCNEPSNFSCQPFNGWGTAANILIKQVTPPAGEGIGFWVSLDYGVGTTTHYWFQAGYIVGLAPDDNWYSQPILYVEYNNGAYVFKVVATNVAYSMNHFFQVWISALVTPPTGYIQVDGNVIVNVPAPSQMANGDQITGYLEAHQLQSLGTAGNIWGTGVWSSLYYAAVSPAYCPSLSCSAWYPWGTDPLQPFYNTLGVPVITNPYTAASLSSTSFTAYLGGAIGGGGCTCKLM